MHVSRMCALMAVAGRFNCSLYIWFCCQQNVVWIAWQFLARVQSRLELNSVGGSLPRLYFLHCSAAQRCEASQRLAPLLVLAGSKQTCVRGCWMSWKVRSLDLSALIKKKNVFKYFNLRHGLVSAKGNDWIPNPAHPSTLPGENNKNKKRKN